MAEPVGLASGILALAVFALKSGLKLSDAIKEFHSHPRQVRDLLTELSGLTSLLRKLSEIGDLSLGEDLTALQSTLELCRLSCDDVTTELQSYCSRSRADQTSFRDWAKLKCSSGGSIDGFRQQLIAYKSTIAVALSFANLRASTNTTEAIHACRDLVATAAVDLEAHLEDVQQRLEALTRHVASSPSLDAALRQRMEDEQRSTEKGLEFCAALSQAIEKLQVDFFGGERTTSSIQDGGLTSAMLFGEGLDGCKHHMRFTLDQLENHRKRIAQGLASGSTTNIPAQDQASLDKLQAEARALRHCLNYCSDIDAVLELQVSNIENHAEGDDTIQFMVSTTGRPINGTNRGIGLRLKQAGGHFSEESLQQVSRDFRAISIHQTGELPKDSTSVPDDAELGPQPTQNSKPGVSGREGSGPQPPASATPTRASPNEVRKRSDGHPRP